MLFFFGALFRVPVFYTPLIHRRQVAGVHPDQSPLRASASRVAKKHVDGSHRIGEVKTEVSCQTWRHCVI